MQIEVFEDEFWRVSLESPDLNVYVIRGEDGVSLINTGRAHQHDDLLACLAELGIEKSDVTRTLSTSWRPGALEGHPRFEHAEHFIFSKGPEALTEYPLWFVAERDRLGELREALDFPKAIPKVPHTPIQHGDIWSAGPYEFEVLHAPGPDAGHIFLLEPKQRWLFTGDVAFDGLPIVDNVDVYLKTLNMASAMKPKFAFPNQGEIEARGEWALARTTRFANSFLSNVTSALVTQPTLQEWVERDLGFTPEKEELLLEMCRILPFFEELVRGGHIQREGTGLEARYISRFDDPRRDLR